MIFLKHKYTILIGVFVMGGLLLVDSQNKEEAEQNQRLEQEHHLNNSEKGVLNVYQESHGTELSGEQSGNAIQPAPLHLSSGKPENKVPLTDVLDRLRALEASLDDPDKRLIVKQSGNEIVELESNATSSYFNQPVAKYMYQEELLVSYTEISYSFGEKKAHTIYLVYDENKDVIDYKERWQ
ncbi:hypothetical protein [Pseudoalteromonas sp. R3]|uniref:hypothetical protein n=1 Tax=Pseudoalteromonas sp. R3 TaxID=1709477 RepID=UPI0006B687E1|nr:hypothetical protein [Pseudoalteromonas sp. R3]AZZ96409.1 hypothetical protein ELR70_04310 [Pseudoalteromonas sp. R3]